MDCPFYTKKKRKVFTCMRYSSPHYQEDCPYSGDLDVCKEQGGSKEPALELPFQ